MNLTISSQTTESAVVVTVTGEVDVSNADELRNAVDAALEHNPGKVEVDLSGVGYIDSTGIGVLVGASHRADESGCGFVVANPQTNVRRVLGLLGVEKELKIGE